MISLPSAWEADALPIELLPHFDYAQCKHTTNFNLN